MSLEILSFHFATEEIFILLFPTALHGESSITLSALWFVLIIPRWIFSLSVKSLNSHVHSWVTILALTNGRTMTKMTPNWIYTDVCIIPHSTVQLSALSAGRPYDAFPWLLHWVGEYLSENYSLSLYFSVSLNRSAYKYMFSQTNSETTELSAENELIFFSILCDL